MRPDISAIRFLRDLSASQLPGMAAQSVERQPAVLRFVRPGGADMRGGRGFFHLMIGAVFVTVLRLARSLGDTGFIFMMPLMPAVGGLLTGIAATHMLSNGSGSGVAQVKAVYYQEFGGLSRISAVLTLYSFTLSSRSCGAG